jgi:hypothetical protein
MKLMLMIMLPGDLDLTLKVIQLSIQLSCLSMETAGGSSARRKDSEIRGVDQFSRSTSMEHCVIIV